MRKNGKPLLYTADGQAITAEQPLPTEEEARRRFRDLLHTIYEPLKSELRPHFVLAMKEFMGDCEDVEDFTWHAGKLYHFIEGGTGNFQYVTSTHASELGRRGEVDYEYIISGAHEGEPIAVVCINVKDESDEGGTFGTCDKIVWADTREPLPDWLSESYNDAMHDELTRSVLEWER